MFEPTEGEFERLITVNGSLSTDYVNKKVDLEDFKKEVNDI